MNHTYMWRDIELISYLRTVDLVQLTFKANTREREDPLLARYAYQRYARTKNLGQHREVDPRSVTPPPPIPTPKQFEMYNKTGPTRKSRVRRE